MIDMIQQVIQSAKTPLMCIDDVLWDVGNHPSGTWVSTLGSQKKLDADWQTRQNDTLVLFGVWYLVLLRVSTMIFKYKQVLNDIGPNHLV